ncbi:hypothetical protein BT63DRAFT_373858 [Microthyrium microscopicum]|uniref:Genetic interactor of prohibitins 3, mitochondrial n=1 Tax=Microthyrium microscopicum TaxID=703497 RepID=A0A6A6UAK0_9PEZI|nr:hypothetical protein BT63DRAFT_373858 [Microthyrium microscopicum]
MKTDLFRALTLARREVLPFGPSYHTAFRFRLLPAARVSSPFSTLSPWRNQVHTSSPIIPDLDNATALPVKSPKHKELPVNCPGCGAYTQAEQKDEAGFYSLTRGAVQLYRTQDFEEAVYQKALSNLSPEAAKAVGIDNALADQALPPSPKTAIQPPYCDRCHNLVNHSIGEPIVHPPVKAIEETISESPHKSNHIWHVIDAADFPQSLILNIDKRIAHAHLRTRNRRSKDKKFVKGGLVDMNFIITRSDLLAPKKEQVDRLVPKLREILREKLGLSGRNVRMGNLHVVSAERGWWTKDVKEQIALSNGANWLVGRVNVGKSKLFESIFPKGTNREVNQSKRQKEILLDSPVDDEELLNAASADEADSQPHLGKRFSLLPPAQVAAQYPMMPIISGLPGTTASPIRVPFRDGRGELIDLPGVQRPSLELYVHPNEQSKLIMTSRVTPERIVMKPGTSVLLGGLIRIKPISPDTIIMAHSFTPLPPHKTSNEKAEQIHNGQLHANIKSMALRSELSKMASAGIYKLNTDVTRSYTGALTRRDGVGLKPERLPFVMYGTDILIEGVGWVELLAQVRKPKNTAVRRQLIPASQEMLDLEMTASDTPPEEIVAPTTSPFPEVEVFSPEGKYIAQRTSLCAFALGGPLQKKVAARPRRSMKSVKSQRRPQEKFKPIRR